MKQMRTLSTFLCGVCTSHRRCHLPLLKTLSTGSCSGTQGRMGHAMQVCLNTASQSGLPYKIGLFFTSKLIPFLEGCWAGDSGTTPKSTSGTPPARFHNGIAHPVCDSCGVCNGADQDQDCLGVCFGTAQRAQCGTCLETLPGFATPPDPLLDCNNVCNGTAFRDDCNACGKS